MTRVDTSPADLKALIRSRRTDLDARIAAGTVAAPRPLTYTQPKGPSIRGGPHGWSAKRDV